MKKNVRIYETLDSAARLDRERTSSGLRLTGVFGKCGVRNSNNRVYEKGNYGQMVRILQEEIAEKHGVMGELEHPNSMNINLNNVSHKIESIQMNEDGTVTGSILLLNTSKGKEAQAIIEGGLDLYISSRASGQIDKNGNVVLETLKTYDLVGTPGFSEARLSICESLAPSEKVHMINENLYYITEDDDLDDDIDDDTCETECDDNSEKNDNTNMEENNCDQVCNDEILKQILDRLNSIEEKLASCADKEETEKKIDTAVKDAVEESCQWVKQAFTPAVQKWVQESIIPAYATRIGESTENWLAAEYTPKLEQWITEEFAAKVSNWVTEEFSGTVNDWVCTNVRKDMQKWVKENYTTSLEKWINEELCNSLRETYANDVEGWISEQLLPEVDKYLNEHLMPEIYGNISEYIAESKKTSLDTIDAMLDMVESKESANDTIGKMITESEDEFSGNIALELMPRSYRPLWNMCNESKKAEILNRAKLYDFVKEGAADKFWDSIDFTTQPKPVPQINESVNTMYENSVIKGIRRLKKF